MNNSINFLDKMDIINKRQTIDNHYSNKYPVLSSDLIKELVFLYDKIFFKDQIQHELNKTKISMKCIPSQSMTKTAGSVQLKDNKIILKISNPIIEKITPLHIAGLKDSCSQPITNRLHAIMTIIEHEIIHILQFLNKEERGINHNEWFKNQTKIYFDHVNIRHNLIESPTINTKDNFNLNEQVCFYSKDVKYIGNIIKLNPKRAQIKVNDTIYAVYYNQLHKHP